MMKRLLPVNNRSYCPLKLHTFKLCNQMSWSGGLQDTVGPLICNGDGFLFIQRDSQSLLPRWQPQKRGFSVQSGKMAERIFSFCSSTIILSLFVHRPHCAPSTLVLACPAGSLLIHTTLTHLSKCRLHERLHVCSFSAVTTCASTVSELCWGLHCVHGDYHRTCNHSW